MQQTENPYVGSTHHPHKMRVPHWDRGRADRTAGKPCSSANGAYLEGWYSVQNPAIYGNDETRDAQLADAAAAEYAADPESNWSNYAG